MFGSRGSKLWFWRAPGVRDCGRESKENSSWRVEGLKEFRLRVGVNNQRLLARHSGVTQQTISFLEAGRGYISPALAAELAPLLGVKAADLRLAHNLWIFRKKLDRGGLTPSATLYALKRLLSMQSLVSRPGSSSRPLSVSSSCSLQKSLRRAGSFDA